MRPALERVRFVAGVDPVRAGVHDREWIGHTVQFRSDYLAHCCYPWGQLESRPPTTIVLPPRFGSTYASMGLVEVVVHELAHEVDRLTGFLIDVPPVTEYAHTNSAEAFAEAFTLWLCPEYPSALDELPREAREQLERIRLPG